mgnify:CR=1 FL=1
MLSTTHLRIASLIPSGTDIAAYLGLERQLVGVSHCCDHPSVAHLPVLTHSRIPSHHDAPPLEVDNAVSSALSSGESLYLTHRELLEQLKPDIVLSQDICDVCAVSADQASCDLPEGAQLIMLSATSLAGLWDDLERVGSATNTLERAREAVQELQNRLERLKGQVCGRVSPRVLALEWSDPPFLGGHWIPELIELAGGNHVLSGPGEASRRSSWAEISAADPDVIVFMPCGYTLPEAETEAKELFERDPVFANLRAVRQGRLWATDATRLFSRCTPVSVRATEVLAGIFHGVYDFESEEALRIGFEDSTPRATKWDFVKP